MRTQSWTITVPTDPQTLWDYLADYRNDIALCDDRAKATLVSGAPGTVGATYAVVIPWEGMRATFDVALADATPGRCLHWTSTTGESSGDATYTLEPTPSGGTNLTVQSSLELHGAFGPLEPFGWSLLSRFAEKMLQGLQQRCEAPAGLV